MVKELDVYIVTQCSGGKNLEWRDLVTLPKPIIRGNMG